ncbi:transposable element Tcb2 transposase [Trichonephila clavipes]|nr:transposable element Tcb2 transposase [Trichonephila clavipes]
MVTSRLKRVSWLGNKFQTSGTLSRKAGKGLHRASTSAQDRYLAFYARRPRWTMAPQLVRDLTAVSGRRISLQTVYNCFAETDIYSRLRVWCVPLAAYSRSLQTRRENGSSLSSFLRNKFDRFGGKGIFVCVGTMLKSRTPLYIIDAGTVNSQSYRDEFLEVYVWFF